MATETSMDGRVCLITGANSGIGKETALALARTGATVVMVARNESKGKAALADVRERAGSERIELMLADLASLESVRGLASEFRELHEELHVLINNAGAFNGQRLLTQDGFEMTFGVNHIAHFLLTNLLLDLLMASAPSRIINVSSRGHMGADINFDDLQGERKYSALGAYRQSKLANVLFTNELARRLEGTGVTANSLHPGGVKTGFGRNNTGVIGALFRVGLTVVSPFLLTAERGAETSIYLASSSEVEDVTGKYFVKNAPAKSSDISLDADVARRLWQVSEELVK